MQRVSIPDYLHFRKTFKAGRFKTSIPVSLFTEYLVHFVSKKITDDRTGDNPRYPPGLALRQAKPGYAAAK